MEQTIQIDFRGDKVTVVVKDNIPYVALKPIVRSLGLAWPRQWKIVADDVVLSKRSITEMVIERNGKKRKQVFLQLDYLNGWLFKINVGRYADERRQKLIDYQDECYHVLNDYFQHGGAINPEATPSQLAGLRGRIEYYRQFMPMDEKGIPSRVSGRERVLLVRSYFRAYPRRSSEVHPDLLDLIGFPQE